jgi:hypothetical protein
MHTELTGSPRNSFLFCVTLIDSGRVNPLLNRQLMVYQGIRIEAANELSIVFIFVRKYLFIAKNTDCLHLNKFKKYNYIRLTPKRITMWNWLLRNFGNFLSGLSILITIYFGVFYVPSYLKDAQQQKIQNSKEVIEQSLKELVYSDSTASYAEVNTLVRAQEIVLGQTFPLRPDELLTEVENSFMQDKFLPLPKRRELLYKIEQLKLKIPPVGKPAQQTENHGTFWLTLLSFAITLAGTVFGLLSAFYRYRQQKAVEEEAENTNLQIDHILPQNHAAVVYEEAIYNLLKAYPGVENVTLPLNINPGFDLTFKYKGEDYFVEIKYLTKSKVGLNTLRQFIYMLKGLEGNFWLIHNSDLTSMTQEKFKEFAPIMQDKRNVLFVQAANAEALAAKLPELLS